MNFIFMNEILKPIFNPTRETHETGYQTDVCVCVCVRDSCVILSRIKYKNIQPLVLRIFPLVFLSHFFTVGFGKIFEKILSWGEKESSKLSTENKTMMIFFIDLCHILLFLDDHQKCYLCVIHCDIFGLLARRITWNLFFLSFFFEIKIFFVIFELIKRGFK